MKLKGLYKIYIMSFTLNNIKKDQLIIQLKNNWARINPLTIDQRTLFERIYDCFEVIGELETELTEGKMIVALKSGQNEIRIIFDRMLNNSNFLNWLSQLKRYSPIGNNTRENKEVVIIDEKNFNKVIDVIYTVRNNLRHGKEEYTLPSEKIIRTTNNIFYKIVAGARSKYI